MPRFLSVLGLASSAAAAGASSGAALAAAVQAPDGLSLVQRSVFGTPTPKALKTSCASLTAQITKSSREEALPAFQEISDVAYHLLELHEVTELRGCLEPMANAASYNHPFALVAEQTKGRSFLGTAVECLKRYPDDSELHRSCLPWIASLADPAGGDELVHDVADSGGLDAIFAGLAHFTNDTYGDIQVMSWATLSEFAHTQKGAAFIADHGGRTEGCEIMMEHLALHPQPHFAKTARSLTLRYEILHLVEGVLGFEAAEDRAKVMVDEGLVDHLVSTLRLEQDLSSSVGIACRVMAKAIPLYAPTLPLLREANATELVRAAVAQHTDTDGASATQPLLMSMAPCGKALSHGRRDPTGEDCGKALSLLTPHC